MPFLQQIIIIIPPYKYNIDTHSSSKNVLQQLLPNYWDKLFIDYIYKDHTLKKKKKNAVRNVNSAFYPEKQQLFL